MLILSGQYKTWTNVQGKPLFYASNRQLIHWPTLTGVEMFWGEPKRKPIRPNFIPIISCQCIVSVFVA